jgi:hypothetical protein
MKSPIGALALLAILPGCSLPTPVVPAAQAAPTEFRSTLVGYGEKRAVEISTKKGRFRLEDKGRVLIGDLDRKGEIVVLSADTRTYFRSKFNKFAELLESHGRPAATRYEGAVNSSLIQVRDQVLAPMQGPCQVVARDRPHQDCQHTSSGEHLQNWTHTSHGRTSAQAGFKATQATLTHGYNTELGVIVSASEGPYLKSPEVVDLANDRFEVPEGYSELLSEDQLRDPRFDYLATPSSFSGSDWEGFMEFVNDGPPPPERPKWTYQKEKWWPRAGGQDLVLVERLYSYGRLNLDKLPLDQHFAFAVKAWDKTPEFGERCFRESPKSVVFAVHNQLFKIQVTQDSRIELIPQLAEALVARARKDRPPASSQ